MDDGLMGTIDSDPHEKCVALGATGDIVADTESVEVFHRNRPETDHNATASYIDARHLL